MSKTDSTNIPTGINKQTLNQSRHSRWLEREKRERGRRRPIWLLFSRPRFTPNLRPHCPPVCHIPAHHLSHHADLLLSPPKGPPSSLSLTSWSLSPHSLAFHSLHIGFWSRFFVGNRIWFCLCLRLRSVSILLLQRRELNIDSSLCWFLHCLALNVSDLLQFQPVFPYYVSNLEFDRNLPPVSRWFVTININLYLFR